MLERLGLSSGYAAENDYRDRFYQVWPESLFAAVKKMPVSGVRMVDSPAR